MRIYGTTRVTTSMGVVRPSGLLDLQDPRTGVVTGNTEFVRAYACNDSGVDAFMQLKLDLSGHTRERVLRIRCGDLDGCDPGDYDEKAVQEEVVGAAGTFTCCLRPNSFVEIEAVVTWSAMAAGVGTPLLSTAAFPGGALRVDSRNAPPRQVPAPNPAPAPAVP